jgi:hypothetical protein
MWIVVAAVGLVVIIIGVKYFGGSAPEDETAVPQRLAQREAQTEHSGWSVRSKSEDLPTSDDVKVQRQIEAKPGNIAPPRKNQPAEAQGGQPPEGVSVGEKPAQPGNEIAAEADVGSGAPRDLAGDRAPNAKLGTGAPNANVGAAANSAGSAALGAPGTNPSGEQHAAADTQPGSEQNPTHDQQAQPAPPEGANPPAVIGMAYDSKDTTFSTDTPVEVKDIGPLSGSGVTMQMQLTTDLPADNQDDATLLKLGDNLELSKNVNFMRLEYFDSAGKPYGIGSDMTTWAAQGIEQPFDIKVEVSGNHLWMTVNDKVVAKGTVDGPPFELQPNPSMTVGCMGYAASRPCAPNVLSNVQVISGVHK